MIPKQTKRGDNGRYQSVDHKGRSAVRIQETKEPEMIEPQPVYQHIAADGLGEEDDDEICEICKRKFVQGREQEILTWIACDNDDCGKWYHSFCQGMTNEECKEREEKEMQWFCSDDCKSSHMKRISR